MRKKQIKQYNLNGELIFIWDSAKEASKELKINYNNIISCCNKRIKTAGGFIWSNKNNDDLSWNILNKNKKIVQLSLKNELIKIWDNIQDIKTNNQHINIINIIRTCNNKQNSSYGFKWKYYNNYINEKDIKNNFGFLIKINDNIIDTRKYNEKKMKPVAQYTLEGKKIKSYASILEAEKTTQIYHIYECVNKKRKTAGGYIWQIEKGELYE